jgi:hypothetical protein
MAGKAKLGAIGFDDRCSPNEGPNEPLALRDRFRNYRIHRRDHSKALHGVLTEISHLAN